MGGKGGTEGEGVTRAGRGEGGIAGRRVGQGRAGEFRNLPDAKWGTRTCGTRKEKESRTRPTGDLNGISPKDSNIVLYRLVSFHIVPRFQNVFSRTLIFLEWDRNQEYDTSIFSSGPKSCHLLMCEAACYRTIRGLQSPLPPNMQAARCRLGLDVKVGGKSSLPRLVTPQGGCRISFCFLLSPFHHEGD